ncbi:glucokinase [Maricaulis sp.]|uniref:glucokinase n=1 Tax=Maricaulis sp. TaxID=1486257 RepID=UPI0026096C86|nr:glucokinase [Maricaulis sp.]
MSTAPSYLVADIGGTNARFAIARGSVRGGFELEQIRRLKNEHFENLRDAAHAFLESCTGARPERGCFAVAGPVAQSTIRLTNSTWKFKPEELAKELQLDALLPVNDFAAQARGAPLIPSDDLVTLNAGTPDPGAPYAVLGPGTGLGLGLLIPHNNNLLVVPTEGGHAGFAPRTQEEIAVGRFIADEYGFVSWERLLSGRGLVNIHRAMCHIDGEPWPGYRPEEITAEALASADSMSRRVVNLFCAVLGAYAGDVAVMAGARGGVFLGGGILPKIRPLLESSAFLARFTRRGPMTHYAGDIPISMITSDAAPLLGAAALAEFGGL